jgi:hypothetical protein
MSQEPELRRKGAGQAISVELEDLLQLRHAEQGGWDRAR